MKKSYFLKNDENLSFHDIPGDENGEKSGIVPPTDAMQERFLQNCVDEDILGVIYL